MADNNSSKRIDSYKKLIELIVASIALITAITGWINNSSKISQQQEEIHKHEQELAAQQRSISRLESCSGEVSINIADPKNHDEVSSLIDVKGTCTIHDRCRYVYIIVREEACQAWRVTDLVQVNTNEKWTGKAKLDNISIGAKAEVSALIVAQPREYRIDAFLPVPPDKGVPSNIVYIKKIQ